MSGHSKWAKVKHIKAVQDVKKGRVYSRHAREITVAARMGGGNPDLNARLRNAILAARAASVPGDNIERAIKKGTGELGGATIEEITYEGFAPGGVAVLVEVMTDNRNRTFPEIRHLFEKSGTGMGSPGSVARLFDRKGFFLFSKEGAPSEERLMEVVLESGAEDLKDDGETWEVTCPPDAFQAVHGALEKVGVKLTTAEISRLPNTTVRVEGKVAQQVLRFIDALEDHDDVQHVYANFDMDESEMNGAA